ncbi:restriction endonuclease [Acidithiobacillus marinus]|uniref:Restriction endonuclease n=2 Tax=Acidithiobacillus marinus TaxID=187490 RepID=A0A2I1DLK1_9PROT|nr:restriction endonuclease [Acidithiobacillus marinus]
MQRYPFSHFTPPLNWSLVALEDISADVSPGFANGKHNSDGTGIPHLRPMNVDRSGQIDLNVVKSVAESNGIELLSGDVLFNNTNSAELVGKTAVVSTRETGFVFSNHMTRIRPEFGVNPAFAARQLHFLWMTGYMKHRCTNHVNQASISSKTLAKTIPFLLPPAAEQTRIVAKLEELLSDLDTGVAELKAAQKKLAQYRQSLLKAAVEGALTAEWRQQHSPAETGAQLLQRILQERRARWEAKQLARFKDQGKTPPKDWQKKYPEPVQPNTSGLPKLPQGWAWASVEQIASDERYSLSIGPFGSNLKVPDYQESGVPLVFVRNIRSSNYGGEHTKFVTPAKAVELSAHNIAAGDVLVTKMGEPPGDADVYPDDQPPAIITADCIKIRCWRELMAAHFLKFAINSHIGKRQIEPMTQGVAQKKVSLGRFSSLAVPVPPAAEQAEIVRMVNEADHEAVEQLEAIELSLKQSTAQRQNILRAAFSGQLVPQDPNDEPASVLLARIRAERGERGTGKTSRGRNAKERN